MQRLNPALQPWAVVWPQASLQQLPRIRYRVGHVLSPEKDNLSVKPIFNKHFFYKIIFSCVFFLRFSYSLSVPMFGLGKATVFRNLGF